ncbi:MAG: lipoprotein transporter ATP-binding protein [Gammaproteobacteria bacterium]|jgi:lipoprotein-releasing system ATP-binding protein|nr:lipoprotein transporter ATP-binding protein [Gammaproteobacteria bacterium]
MGINEHFSGKNDGQDAPNMGFVLEARGLGKTYQDGQIKVEVLQGVDLTLAAGELVAVIGTSGVGKSTLLHLLGGLDRYTAGEVRILNQEWRLQSERQRCQLRNEKVGFVYQLHHLLPEFNVLENVCMPLFIAGEDPTLAQEKAADILEKVGLAHRLRHRIGELSGGERQRTAIARALVKKPACVLADEPTGNLDQHTAEKVYDLFLELNRAYKTSLIMVTHDMRLAERLEKVYQIVDKKLERQR